MWCLLTVHKYKGLRNPLSSKVGQWNHAGRFTYKGRGGTKSILFSPSKIDLLWSLPLSKVSIVISFLLTKWSNCSFPLSSLGSLTVCNNRGGRPGNIYHMSDITECVYMWALSLLVRFTHCPSSSLLLSTISLVDLNDHFITRTQNTK